MRSRRNSVVAWAAEKVAVNRVVRVAVPVEAADEPVVDLPVEASQAAVVFPVADSPAAALPAAVGSPVVAVPKAVDSPVADSLVVVLRVDSLAAVDPKVAASPVRVDRAVVVALDSAGNRLRLSLRLCA